jgi:type II secretory pathway predicted ATPase ExeA
LASGLGRSAAARRASIVTGERRPIVAGFQRTETGLHHRFGPAFATIGSVNQDSPRGPAFYEHFFGFHRPPFSLAPDTRFRFQSASHAAALEQITYALERREPIIVVTGEIGTGKTLLCRTVVEQSGRKTFVSVINDPALDCDDLLKRMLEDFGVVSRDRTAMTPTSRHDLVHALQEFLRSLVPIQAHAAVIIDEAQHARPDVLEQFRLVSNVQDEQGTLLQIILVGQTDLDRLLAKPELRQLSQRVSRFVRLDPLSANELELYIRHRLGVAREQRLPSKFPGARELERELADWDGSPQDPPFTPDAIAAVGRISGGIPRVVNLLCDRALEAAFSTQLRKVDAPLIDTAAAALGLTAAAAPAASALPVWPEVEPAEHAEDSEAPSDGGARSKRYAIVAALFALAAAAAWFGVRQMSQPSRPDRVSSAPTPAPRPAAQPPAAQAPAAQAPAAQAPAAQAPAAQALPAQAASAAAAPLRPAATPPAAAQSTPPRASTPAPASPAPGTNAASSAPIAGQFEIVVASFHTTTRATEVAAAIAALPEPVHQRESGGWQQVLAGPYRSADDARAAQQRLERAGFTGTHLTPATR